MDAEDDVRFPVAGWILASAGMSVRGGAAPSLARTPARAEVPLRCMPSTTTACRAGGPAVPSGGVRSGIGRQRRPAAMGV